MSSPTQDEIATMLSTAIVSVDEIEEKLGEMSTDQKIDMVFVLMGFWHTVVFPDLPDEKFVTEFRPFIDGYLEDYFPEPCGE